MSTKPRVLIVDDEPDVVANWSRLLGRDDYACTTATDGERALALLESERPEIVLTDLKMPRVDGMHVLTRARELDPDVVVIMITGHGSVESAVEAMRAGAFDYLLKPLPSNDVLRLAVERAAERRRLVEENRRLREPLAPRAGFDNVIGKSAAMEAVFDLVRKAARSEANILIQGESGTGKGADRPGDPRAERPGRRGVRSRRLRRTARCVARVRAVRSRARRVHRRGPDQAGNDRGRGPGHPLSRRDRGAAPGAPVQAPPGAPGAADPSRRGNEVRQRGHPSRVRDQSRHGGARPEGGVSRRSLLPRQRDHDRVAAPPGAGGGRGAARAPFSAPVRAEPRASARGDRARRRSRASRPMPGRAMCGSFRT